MPAETVSVLEKAEEQALRAGETLRRLRDFLRRDEIQLSTRVLRDALAAAAAVVRNAAERAGVAVLIRPAPEALRVLADRVHLTQILVNLMNNAVEALQVQPAGSRQVAIRAGEAAGGWIEIAVTDSGPGVPAEHRERIFDSFYTTKSA